ncbi:MAG TPA: hypothetical protein VNW94_14955 [Streptosporangiaceae bacterium]|nr:hypothetical protein [Streptosporangiaceae bacterium]
MPKNGQRHLSAGAPPGVDHRSYDTTSILATIERGLHLAPLSTRDAQVNDLIHALHTIN